DCGLGKTLSQLAWAEMLYIAGQAHDILLLCPIAVAEQTLAEAEKFDIACDVDIADSQSEVSLYGGITITNYEKLHKFDTTKFQAVVLDEASILKSFAGAVKRQLCEAFEDTPHKLCCTATPAPNDHMELG